MEQLETMSSYLKESDKLSDVLKLEENFRGFDTNDEVLMVIEKKKKCVKVEIHKESGLPMDVDEPDLQPIVVNNHVYKISEPKSSTSTPEMNDKHNQSVNKRLKKDNLQTKSIVPVESNIQPSLELTTPTFGLTSTSRGRRSVGRKMNIDISDPIFKIPFEYGWKRELVYRTSGDSTANNRINRNGDVYYYSPNNRKLRSLREIQEQLNLALSDNSLTIESFTFLKQPIGMNDKSKELIRDANTKLSKEDSFSGAAARAAKRSKTPQRQPYDYELLEKEKNKSNKMKIIFKNIKRTRAKHEKITKSNLEAFNKSSSTPEYIAEDWEAIQSSVTPKASPLSTDHIETNTTNNKRRLSTSDGEVIMQAPCGIRCSNSDEPATLMCAQCLVYYHPACVNLNANLKIVGYVCINCRSSIRQRNRRVQSSHTVVVGASELEQPRVEPIRIRQVQQTSETSNFVIEKSPTKTEEPDYEIDEYIDENPSVITNTVTCQGNVYKTAMTDHKFHEQYVYEMKQTRGPSLMTCVIQEPKNLDESSEMNGSLRETPTMASMQSFNYMSKTMKCIFKYLKVQELLSASRVCIGWNMIAMHRLLWQNVKLKNSMVYDWEKCVEFIENQGSISLDTKRMLIPSKTEDFESFWLRFSAAMKKAKKLKVIELYRCPTHVVEDAIYYLPQLTVLNATSIKNPALTRDSKNVNDYMTLNLGYLGQMTNLTEIRLKGLSGIKLTSLTSFEKLVNLRILSLTSMKGFPKDFYHCLETITTDLESLEIGDCDWLSNDFVPTLQRLTNLTSLRLENCCGKWANIAKEVFVTIRNLKKLRTLELINIEFSNCVEDELEQCSGIKALLIIPAYVSQSATTNCHLLDCVRKLSNTLTHLVWGLTHELLRVTDLFITQYQQNQRAIGFNLGITPAKEPSNNIPILRTRKPKPLPGEEPIEGEEQDKSDNVDILSVPSLEKLLETVLVNAKTKVIKIAFSSATRVYLNEYFNDL